MIRRKFLQGAIGIAGLLSTAPLAMAHRERLSLSDVVWSNESQTLSATHRLHLDDARKTMMALGHTDELSSLRGQALFAIYVSETFGLFNLQEKPIQLSIIGAETEGHHIFVYQEAQLKTKPDGLWVSCNILRDIFPDQKNHANVTLSGGVQTLTFSGTDGAKLIP